MTDLIECKFQFLQNDYLNLKNEISKIVREKDMEIEFLKKNLKFVLDKLQMSFRNRHKCQKCEGIGKLYISPISDCGQSNICLDCGGMGCVWS